MTHYLYRHWSDAGGLLYVGVTNNPAKRIKDHNKCANWFEQVNNITLQKYETRESVLKAERQAIIDEQPEFNIQHIKGVRDEPPEEEETRIDITARLQRVQFKPCYTMEEIGELFGNPRSGPGFGMRLTESGEMGFIEVVKPRSPLGRMKRYVTGWQLITYLEHLEQRRNHERASVTTQ
tara:strand:+ start:297 stop:833 length:537 start_codon:yes stop_codon:yes gene_type:complete